MQTNKPKSRTSVGKVGRKRKAMLASWKVPTRVEIRTVNFNGKMVEADLLLHDRLVPGLAPEQRAEICKAAGVHFLTPDDWKRVEASLDELAWHSKTARDGIACTEVQAGIEEFKRRAIQLRDLMSDTDGGKIAAGKITWFLAWHYGGRKKCAVQVLSELIESADRASAYMAAEKGQGRESSSPFAEFVGVIEYIFCTRGVGVSAPKPKDYENPSPSQFQNFIRALLAAVPEADPSINTSDIYVAALMSRISTALAEWRKYRSAIGAAT